MDDLARQAAGVLRATWKHRWLGVGVAWLVAAIGVAIVLNIPDKYMATARLYIDTRSILKPLMADLAVQPNVDLQVAMLSQTLISRPNVEKLIRMAGLDGEGKSEGLPDGLVDRVMKNLEIKSTSLENLYTLAYRDPDPEKAVRVLQSMVSIFIETKLGDSRKDSAAARKFIDSQIQIYEKKLQEAESRLKEFRLQHIDMQAVDGKAGAGQLTEASADLAKARLELREAESSRDVLKRQIVEQGSVSISPAYSRMSDAAYALTLEGRLEAQKKNLDSLLQRYTERHPDVISARHLIRELEEQRRAEIAERKKKAAANPGSVLDVGNSGNEKLNAAYAEAEAKVASLQARVSEYESRYAEIKRLQKAEPEVEAELARLNRDYDIHKKNYEALVARRESASLASAMDSAPGVEDFRLVDPPRASPKPVAPNRLLLLPLVLLLALGAGGFASYAASEVRSVFFDARSLREATGLPLLGCISLVDSGGAIQMQERADLRRFGFALGSLIGAFSVGLLLVFMISVKAA